MIKIDEGQVKAHLQEMVIDTVEQTLNGYLDEEAEKLCGAKRYEQRWPQEIGQYAKVTPDP